MKEKSDQDLAFIFRLKEPMIPVACIAIGHPAETKEPRTRFNSAYERMED